MIKSYKTQLAPNNHQISKMKMNCGAARFAYNYALNLKKEAFDKKEKIPNYIDVSKSLNILKQSEDYKWIKNSISFSSLSAIIDCDKAFNNFFRRCKDKKFKHKGFPKFKSKRNNKQSFRIYGLIKVLDNGYIRFPKIGNIKLCQKDYLPQNIKIESTTVSHRAGKWFVSIQVKEDIKFKEKNNNVIGIDLGIKSLATCSDGTVYENLKALKSNLRLIKKKSRQLSRKKKGSNNRLKAKQRLSKLYYRISNIRKDILHKTTSKIVNENQVIVLEDLNVSGMLKNRKLSRAISDVGFYEFRRQIEYKAKWYGREVVIVNKFFSSSKLCSSCGNKKQDLKLSDRTYKCDVCHASIDRDLNAAYNLRQYYTASRAGIDAFGDGSSGHVSDLSPSLN